MGQEYLIGIVNKTNHSDTKILRMHFGTFSTLHQETERYIFWFCVRFYFGISRLAKWKRLHFLSSSFIGVKSTNAALDVCLTGISTFKYFCKSHFCFEWIVCLFFFSLNLQGENSKTVIGNPIV